MIAEESIMTLLLNRETLTLERRNEDWIATYSTNGGKHIFHCKDKALPALLVDLLAWREA